MNEETYEGTEPYLFISYSHQDNKAVEPIIRGLQQIGYRVWYDTGIAVGTRWPDTIAEHLMKSNCVVAFISKNAMESDYCQEEIFFALEEHKPIVVVYLEETKLPPGLRMRLSARQAIYRYQYKTDSEFITKLDKERLVHASKDIKKSSNVIQTSHMGTKEVGATNKAQASYQNEGSSPTRFVEDFVGRYHTTPDGIFITAVDKAVQLQLFSAADLANATGYNSTLTNQLIHQMQEMRLVKELGRNVFRASMNHFAWETYRSYILKLKPGKKS